MGGDGKRAIIYPEVDLSILTRIGQALRFRATNVAAVDLKSFFAAQLGAGGIPEQLNGPEDAFRLLGTVYRCLRVIVGTASIDIDTVDAEGAPVNNAKVRAWLNEPYPGMDYRQWVKRIIGQTVITGGSRLLQVDLLNDKALMPVSLTECRVDGDVNVFPPKGFWYNGQWYDPSRVVSIQGPDPTQINDAYSAVEASGLSADTGFYARKHAARALKGGAFLAALLKYAKNFPSQEKRDEFMNGWNDALKRAKQTGTFPLLEAGGDFTVEKLGLSFVDLALPVVIVGTDKEIARAMGVPPAYLGEDSNSLANFAEQRKIFLEATLEDVWGMIESALNLGMRSRFGGAELRFKFRREQCPIAQEVKSAQGTAQLPAVGKTLTRNEWRASQGLPLWPPEIGDSIGEADAFTGTVPFIIPQPKPKTTRAADAIAEGFRTFLAPAKPAALPASAAVRADPPCNDKDKPHNGRTRNERALFWRAAMLGLDDNEARYRRTFAKIFDGVRAELKASAEAEWEKSHTLAYDRDALRSLMLAKRKAILPAVWQAGKRSGDFEIAAVIGAKRSFTRATSTLSAKAMFELMARAEAWTNLTGDTVYSNVADLIARGVQDGYSLQQMMDALEEFGVGNPENIARTEVLGSLNAGRDDAYRESGVVEGEEWLATQDDRTRDSHAEADGQTVGIDEQFTLHGASGDVKLDYPGDPQGPPEEICQCRCFLLPVVNVED